MLIGAFVILPMFLVIESLMIPVHLRFGGEKGRYALIACVGVLVVIGFVVMKIVEIFHINVLPLILAIDALGPVMFMVILLMIGFLIMLVSLKVSLSIMNKRILGESSMDFTILMVVLLLGIGIPTRNKAIRAYRQRKNRKNRKNDQ